jgi:hypothetical protein
LLLLYDQSARHANAIAKSNDIQSFDSTSVAPPPPPVVGKGWMREESPKPAKLDLLAKGMAGTVVVAVVVSGKFFVLLACSKGWLVLVLLLMLLLLLATLRNTAVLLACSKGWLVLVLLLMLFLLLFLATLSSWLALCLFLLAAAAAAAVNCKWSFQTMTSMSYRLRVGLPTKTDNKSTAVLPNLQGLRIGFTLTCFSL